MRHALAGNKLGRNQTLRKATVRDIARATLINQRITTTKAKAKEARKLVDKLITLGKSGSLADKRRAFAILSDHQLVSRLFKRTSPLFKNRNGGYTRIILLSNRRGDNAQLAYLELTEKEEIIVSEPKSTAQAKKEKLKAKKKEAATQPIETQEAQEEVQEKAKDKIKEEVKEKKESPKAKESRPSVKEEKKEAKFKEEKKPKRRFEGIRKFFRRKST